MKNVDIRIHLDLDSSKLSFIAGNCSVIGHQSTTLEHTSTHRTHTNHNPHGEVNTSSMKNIELIGSDCKLFGRGAVNCKY